MRKIITMLLVFGTMLCSAVGEDIIPPTKPIPPKKPELLLTEPICPNEPEKKVSPFWSIIPFGVPQYMNKDKSTGNLIAISQGLSATLFIINIISYSKLKDVDVEEKSKGIASMFGCGLVFTTAQILEIVNSITEFKQYRRLLKKYNISMADYPVLLKQYNEERGRYEAALMEYNLNKDKYEKELAEYEKKMKEYEIAKREAFLATFTPRESDAIRLGIIFIGMSEGALIASWGKPEDINKTTTIYGVDKQYCYHGEKYVYVENGYITAIQE